MQFRVIVVTDPQTNPQTHKQPPHTHKPTEQDRLQYTAPQLASAQCNQEKSQNCNISPIWEEAPAEWIEVTICTAVELRDVIMYIKFKFDFFFFGF